MRHKIWILFTDKVLHPSIEALHPFLNNVGEWRGAQNVSKCWSGWDLLPRPHSDTPIHLKATKCWACVCEVKWSPVWGSVVQRHDRLLFSLLACAIRLPHSALFQVQKRARRGCSLAEVAVCYQAAPPDMKHHAGRLHADAGMWMHRCTRGRSVKRAP